MNEFLENFKGDVKKIAKAAYEKYAKLVGRPLPKEGTVVGGRAEFTYEINLVPDVKAQMIKALKMRNLVLFICIVVSSVAIGIVVVLFGVKSGQDIAMSVQDKRMEKLSSKLTGYSELTELVTIQHQLTKYNDLNDQKTSVSRVFGAMNVMLPKNGDVVKFSKLRVSLDANQVTLEGLADAKVAPLIDYRVLEAFKKAVELTHYDYGRYVDMDGQIIPTQCIEEADENGTLYKKGESYYAWWDITIPGCEAKLRKDVTEDDEEIKFHYSEGAETKLGVPGHATITETVCDEKGENCKEVIKVADVVEEPAAPEGEETDKDKEKEKEDLTPRPVKVKIWRTPQYNEWYKKQELQLDGTVLGVEHFQSECINYSGTDLGRTVKWMATNDCVLAPDGLAITGSSNGRDASDNLVLRFTASVVFNEDFFAFKNKHMIAIGPMGQNVTDSYVQLGGMFAQAAKPCEEDDFECKSAKENSEGTE